MPFPCYYCPNNSHALTCSGDDGGAAGGNRRTRSRLT